MLANKVSFSKLEIAGNFGESPVKYLPDGWNCLGISTDSRDLEPGNLFVAVKGENSDGHAFVDMALEKGASGALISNKFFADNINKYENKPVIVVKDTLKALGRLANIHRRRFNLPIIAIGGANGKTTTKNFTASVLSQKFNVLSTYKNFNNRIGAPLMLLQLNEEHQVAVLEIGTNEPGEIAILSDIVEPTHGLITNIGKEHLEKLTDLDGVEMEESFLFGFLHKTNGIAFINDDDERLKKYSVIMEDEVTYGTHGDQIMIKASIEMNDGLNPVLKFTASGREFCAKLQTAGYASGLDAIAAAAVGFHFGLTDDEIKNGLESYREEEGQGYGRMFVENLGNIKLINDCYNANPESMKMAFNTLASMNTTGKKYAVLGDMRELGESAFDEHIAVLNSVMLIADRIFITGSEMEKAYNSIVINEKIKHFKSKAELIDELISSLSEAGVILVKGSRGMAMEEVIAAIKKQLM